MVAVLLSRVSSAERSCRGCAFVAITRARRFLQVRTPCKSVAGRDVIARRATLAGQRDTGTASRTRVPPPGMLSTFRSRRRARACPPLLQDLCLSRRKRGLLAVPATQREEEGGTLSHRPLGPHPPSVAAHDSRDRREAYARSLKIIRAMPPLESPEELLGVPGIEAHPVVAHVVGYLVVPVGGTELYGGRLFCGGELEGVAQEVLERHSQETGVPFGHEVLGDHEPRFPVGPGLLNLRCYLAGKRAQINRLVPEGTARHPREVEQVVYEDRKSTRLNSSHANISYA